MNCRDVRKLLPEEALGTMSEAAAEVERHLAWCAACRKEAVDLQRAAATMGFALAPAVPDPELEDAVVHEVRAAAARGHAPRQPRRRRRAAAAVLLAASLAVSGLGWGAVMAGRASRIQDQARKDVLTRDAAIASFQNLVRNSMFADSRTEAMLGSLRPVDGSDANGSALSIVAPNVEDRVLVTVGGLRNDPELLPYRVTLSNARGDRISVGRIYWLQTGGGQSVGKLVDQSLEGFTKVVVRDADGTVVLRGSLEAQAPLASATPSIDGG